VAPPWALSPLTRLHCLRSPRPRPGHSTSHPQWKPPRYVLHIHARGWETIQSLSHSQPHRHSQSISCMQLYAPCTHTLLYRHGHMAEYICCSSAAFERPDEHAFTQTWPFGYLFFVGSYFPFQVAVASAEVALPSSDMVTDAERARRQGCVGK
jgi:hypothetical protein